MNCYLFMRLRLQASVFSVACMFETVLLLIPQRSYARLFLSKNYAFSCTPRAIISLSSTYPPTSFQISLCNIPNSFLL